MAGKFIELKEAAQQLGVTPERLLEMRESGQVHGYRDGATWKFRVEEIERAASMLESFQSADSEDIDISDSAPLSSGDLDALLDFGADGEPDESVDGSSILISEEPKGKAEGGSSTVIGKGDSEEAKEDSDLKLAEETPASGDSDVALVPEKNGDSDVKVVADDESKPVASDSDLKLADDEDLSDELELSSELDFDSDEALMLGEDSELKLADDDGEKGPEESSGSEIPLGASDSGLALSSPSDSGISLEAESSVEGESSSGALELPEDDEMISLEDDLVASPDDATQLQQDEEFLLSPSDEMLGDESSDSGSQVIALEESDSMEEAVGVVADSEEAILEPEEEPEALEAQLETFDAATAVEAGAVPLGVGELPEAPYSIGNIISLLTIILLLTVTGMLMTDVIRNMWAWNGAGTASSTIADAIVSLLRMQ